MTDVAARGVGCVAQFASAQLERSELQGLRARALMRLRTKGGAGPSFGTANDPGCRPYLLRMVDMQIASQVGRELERHLDRTVASDITRRRSHGE
jgi:hypothetical protein